MRIVFPMPTLSTTMAERESAKWLVKTGDVVEPRMVSAEIELDKKGL